MARILVVDEDPLFLAIMSRSLEKARHDVVTATQPAVALELLTKLACDAVVCAMVLPDNEAMDFIRSARTNAAEVPILAVIRSNAVTHQINPDIVRMIQAIGADEVMKKPLETHDFVAQVEHTIAARSARAATSAAG